MIKRNDFLSARKGSKIIDALNRPWIFVGDPIPDNDPLERPVKNPAGEIEELLFSNMTGEYIFFDKEMAIIIELDNPDVRMEN